MNKKKVTSSDVAKYAGVSQTTVSMILNKKYNVSFSKEVVKKVEDAARELGVCASQAQNTERKPQGKASGGFLPESDQSVLCHAFAGNRSKSNGAGVRAVCV